MMSKEDAAHYLAAKKYGRADLAETQLMREVYVHEDDKITDLEKRVLDITRANFTVFGAVALFSNTSFFKDTYGGPVMSIIGLVVIGLVSLAAAVYIVFIHKYVCVLGRKVSILQRGIWRRRPLEWLEAKHAESDLVTMFQEADRLGAWEFLKYGYTMKTINLIPLVVALFGLAYIAASHFVGKL
jgi:hypothetical protein